MTVYVDDAFIPAGVPNGGRVVSSKWCHLMSDTSIEELDRFAAELGLRKAWRQMRPSGVHYDVTLGVRAKAVRAGAVELEAGTPEWRRVAKQARIQYWEDRLL